MHIDVKLPRYSNGELDDAFLRECKTGFKLEQEKEQARITACRKEAKGNRGKTHPVLGKCIAMYPPLDYFRLVAKYGQEEVNSDAFIRRYRQDPDMRHLCPNEV